MKRFVCSVLCFLLLCTMVPMALATSSEATIAANQLHSLGLFQGIGTDVNGNPIYDLDRTPTRYEAITMLVRILGKEQDAKNRNWDTPFTDVANWAKPYVGYAYNNGLTSGTSMTTFNGNRTITASQYLTFMLRALGYSSNTDFKWDTAWELSDKLGFTSGEYSKTTSTFLRGDIAEISVNALSTLQKNSSKTLADRLIDDGIFTKSQYDNAIKNNGADSTEDNPKISKFYYSFVRINDKLYDISYSYESNDKRSNLIYYDENNPSTLYLDSQALNDMWSNGVTLSLLTGTYKLTPSSNPFVFKSIDMFSTYYKSSTIDVYNKEHYVDIDSMYYTTHHSYKGKILDIPPEVENTPSTQISMFNNIRYCGRYINVDDYCNFFSLKTILRIEFDQELQRDILVVQYN